jgi:CheY-like chemotaxis protein
MMDGEIWVESEPGQGTTFSFTANFGLVKEKVKKRFVPSSDVRGMKVLVVDDSATSREILRNILESFSFKVFLAPSGEEALEEIEWADQNEPFKLVLMDWKMSGMDGLETSRRIKAHKALNKIPAIVMVTAYGSEEIMRQADDIGTEGYLHKPVGASMLFDTIMQVFGKEAESPSAIGREVEKTAEGMQSIAGARVLLVEDNEINQQVAQEILQGAGLDVTVVNDGQDGVDAAMQNHYDVILMDIQMPVMDGYEATKRIRKREGGIQNKIGKDSELKSEIRGIPIIAMTAHAMAGDEDKSLKAGMNGHIAKPIDPDQLFSTLQKWIKPNEKRGQTKQPEVPVDSPDPDKAVTEEDELPESLPGFDLAAGLERLRGNKRLYRKLLIDFGANYTGIAAEISDALETKNMNHAHRLVHNLKGLAGNLAATALLSATIELEKLVKGDQKKMPPSKQLNKKLAALESTFTQALESIQAFGLQAQGKISKLSDEEIAAIPSELAQDISNRIRDAAQMGDVMTLNAIAEEIKSQSDTCVPLSKRIVQMAEDIDLDGIEKLADALEAS